MNLITRTLMVSEDTASDTIKVPQSSRAVPPKTVKAKSSVEDGVKLGCGMFIVLPLLILGALIFLVIILAVVGSTL
jgi:hypothetical protein